MASFTLAWTAFVVLAASMLALHIGAVEPAAFAPVRQRVRQPVR